LAFGVGFCYVVALWVNQSLLQSSVPLLVVPLWFSIALRCAGAYVALLFAARYLPELRIWLARSVADVIESEDW
jgi:hypothetical protein